MPEFRIDPPVVRQPGPFSQTIHMLEQGLLVGAAHWHSGTDAGVAQLLDLTITESKRRHGLGQQLLEAVVAQVRLHCKTRKVAMRRLWMCVEQKDQVFGRAFLTQHGFHHVASITELFVDQEALVYMRSFD
jgi:N-acetylglutamate synthase-like GNAT family acetyltransferase